MKEKEKNCECIWFTEMKLHICVSKLIVQQHQQHTIMLFYLANIRRNSFLSKPYSNVMNVFIVSNQTMLYHILFSSLL